MPILAMCICPQCVTGGIFNLSEAISTVIDWVTTTVY